MSPKSLSATQANIDKAMNTIDSQRGGGGTRLLNALQTAFALERQEEDVARTTIIVTDGYVSCEAKAFDLIRENLNKSSVFAFGIGSSVNRHLIEGMARSGQGEPLIVTGPDEAGAKADKFREYIRQPVLTQINVDFDSFNAYDIEPISVPDVLAERPVIVFGKYKGTPRGSVRITGFTGDGEYLAKLDIRPDMEEESNTALRYLWARHRIKMLSDYNNLQATDERVREVTNLGLTYNLLTAYTSFVAIDSLVRNQGGDQATVKQPLPLPQGVSDLAVGGAQRKYAAKTMSYNMALTTESLAIVPATAPLPAPLAPPAVSKERDSFSLGRTLSGLVGGRLSSAPAEAPKMAQRQAGAVHGSKNGNVEISSGGYIAKGEFKSDSEIAVGDERITRVGDAVGKTAMQIEGPGIGPADKSVVQPEGTVVRIELPADEDGIALILLAVGIPMLVAGLLIWRFRAGKKAKGDANKKS